MIEQFKSAKRAAVPILAIETFDPQQTIRSIAKVTQLPLMSWDIIRGLTALNDAAIPIVSQIVQGQDPAIATGNPAEMLSRITRVPECIIFMQNAHRFISNESVAQGIWNLRDIFKTKGAMLIMLAPAITLPDELKQDVMVISEPLPNKDEIVSIVDSITKDAGMEDVEDRDKVADTLVGLSAFAAEQTLATCIEKVGDAITINRKVLWERKCKTIEQTPGLSIWRGGETFFDIGGCENVKSFLTKILNGKTPPNAIAFMDEIEKMFAGSGTDTSGVSQDQLGSILSFMQDKETMGIIFIGPPGAAKSVIAKAAGNTVNIPTIAFDLGAMKNPFVGKSGELVRSSLKVLEAVSQGKILFMATCNSIAVLPPELRRRFTLGTFFFDLPTASERQLIWPIYKSKYGLRDEQCDVVDDTDWTGAEIKQCCNIAYMLGIKLSEASRYIVPVAKSAFEQIDSLRKQASGKFISAGKPGIYQINMTDVLHESYRAL